VAVIDGALCVLLARYLKVLEPALEQSGRLDAIRPALDAIARAAEAQRALDRRALDEATTAGWVSVAEAAARRGCSAQGIRARLARGTLAGDRRGRRWRVEPTQLALLPSQRPA
jgi:hypothetical protein